MASVNVRDRLAAGRNQKHFRKKSDRSSSERRWVSVQRAPKKFLVALERQDKETIADAADAGVQPGEALHLQQEGSTRLFWCRELSESAEERRAGGRNGWQDGRQMGGGRREEERADQRPFQTHR